MSSATSPAVSSTPASFAFVASPNAEAQDALTRLAARYGNVAPQSADVIVALGGDGLMLQTLHRFMHTGKPIYGMHRGTVGFLMNEYLPDDLPERLARVQVTVIHPLLMRAHDENGDKVEFHAFNDVFLYRQTYQAARLRILVDDEERLPNWSLTASWWRRLPARRPTIFPSRVRSFRSPRR